MRSDLQQQFAVLSVLAFLLIGISRVEPIQHVVRRDEEIKSGVSVQPIALEANEIARAAVFLLSDESRMITGDTITVDAGWSVST